MGVSLHRSLQVEVERRGESGRKSVPEDADRPALISVLNDAVKVLLTFRERA
jgi:hypothetical protein